MSHARLVETPSDRGTARPVSRAHDAAERQADRAAEVVSRGGHVRGWSLAAAPPSRLGVQRAPGDDEKKDGKDHTTKELEEAAKTTGKALMKTKAGKELKKRILESDEVKTLKKAATSPAGIVTSGALVAGGIAGLAIADKKLPFQPPSIPADFLLPGLSFQPRYEGRLQSPTFVGVTVTFKPKGKKKPTRRRPKPEPSEKERASGPLRPTKQSAEEARLSQEVIDQVVRQQKYLHPYGFPVMKLDLNPRGSEEKKDEAAEPVQRAPSASPDTDRVGGGLARVDDGFAGSGRPLDDRVRRRMEVRFGHDFSTVRLHDDARAAAAADRVEARAFTVGDDIVLSRHADASSPQLLAHELAHVVQHRTVGPSGLAVARRPTATPTQNTAEPEAPEAESAQAAADRIAGDVHERPEGVYTEFLDYAFFFTGGGYGRSAEEFIRTFYPEHRRVQARSFEAMFDRLYSDVRAIERGGSRPLISQLVIVTHANAAGGLQIPLARDDVGRKRNFTPWDLAELQEEFTDRTHRAWRRRQRFRARRAHVVAEAISDHTQVIVRGCQFGQSEDGLEALRLFFGGEPMVWAPTGFQGYEVAGVGRSHLGDPEEAFDMLQQQGLLPADLELTAEEKREYLARELGVTGRVPSQFFITTTNAYTEFNQLAHSGEGLGEAADELKIREDTDNPSLGEHWGLSSRPDEDPELDSLSRAELERRARILHDNYHPRYARMLLRLRDAWMRHPDGLRDLADRSNHDPLAGLPPIEIFGSGNSLAADAASYERYRPADEFETNELPFATPDELERAAAAEYEEGPGEGAPDPATPASTGSTGPGGSTPGARGRGGADAGGSAERERDRGLLAQARQFDKGRFPQRPEPEEAPREAATPDLSALVISDADLELVQAILESLPDGGWKLSDTLSATELGVNAVSGGLTFVESTAAVFLLEAGLLVVGTGLMFAGLAATLHEAEQAQDAGSRLLGVQLGLQQLQLDAGYGRSPSATRWYDQVSATRDVTLQVAFGYPNTAEETRARILEGMEVVAEAAKDAFTQSERSLRAGLRAAGYSEAEVESTIDAARDRLRTQVFVSTATAVRGLLDDGRRQ